MNFFTGADLYDIFYIVYAVGVLLSIVCIIIVSFQRPSVEQKLLMLISVCSSVIWLGYFATLTAQNIDLSVFGTKLNYLGSCNVQIVFLMFFLRYYKMTIKKWMLALLGGFGIVMTLIIVTFDHHTLYYKSYYLDQSGIIPKLVKEYTPLHNAYIAMVLSYGLLSFLIYLFHITKNKNVNKIHSTLLLLIILCPSISYILEKLSGSVLELVPWGLTITNIFLIYLVSRAKISDINILAREYVFDTIDDALVIMDEKFRFKGANPLARQIFPEIESFVLDCNLQKHSKEVWGIINYHMTTTIADKTFVDCEEKKYQPSLKKVIDVRGLKGYVLWLKDITAERNSYMLLETYQNNLKNDVNKKTEQLQKMQEQMVYGFAALVENKNMVTGGHIKRTSEYVDAIARELKKEGYFTDVLTDNYMEKLHLVAPLHDIGKVSIPETILDKPTKLSVEEYEIIKTHSKNGAKIIEQTMGKTGDDEYISMAKEVAAYHHEKWNGFGYPEGLSGENIPLHARIMAVADVFDALVSDRPYKNAYPIDIAFRIIEEESGNHFDPIVAGAFLRIRPSIENLHHQLCDINFDNF